MQLEENPKTEKIGQREEKFHAHAQMSAMDATSSATALIKGLRMGHPAVAITDSVVQAFQKRWKQEKIRNQNYLWCRRVFGKRRTAIINGDEDSIDRNYVVFDIETTGLSSKR